MFKKFLKDTNGATGIEYALIASLVGLAAITGMTSLGAETMTLYDSVAESVIEASQ